jgi:hypothetical protein
LDSNSLEGTTLLALLQLCVRANCVLRIWRAGDGRNADLNVTSCRTVQECEAFVVSRAHRRWGLRFAP